MKNKRKHALKETTPTTSTKGSAKVSPKRRTPKAQESNWAQQRRQALIDLVPTNIEEDARRYAALIERDAFDDPLTLDELDPLQHELEAMLLHNMQMQRRITNLQRTLDGDEPLTFTPTQSPPDIPLVKRSRSPSASASAFAVPKSKHARRGNYRNDSTPEPQPVPGPDPEVMNLAVSGYDARGRQRIFFCPMNHIPDKFWHYVSQHAPALSTSDAHELEKMAKEHSVEKMHKYLKGYTAPGQSSDKATTSNGKATTTRSKAVSPTFSRRSSRRESALAVAMEESRTRGKRKASEMESSTTNGDGSTLGTLTERLVQAMLEQQEHSTLTHITRLHVNDDTEADTKLRAELVNGTISPNKALVKSLNLANLATLEKRIKSELQSHGFLANGDDVKPAVNGHSGVESESETSDDEDVDEVTNELRQRQAELHQQVSANSRTLHHLVDQCRRHIDITNARAHIEEADNRLLDLFTQYYRQVPKRKPCAKKERDALHAALEERKKALKTFDKADQALFVQSYLGMLSPMC